MRVAGPGIAVRQPRPTLGPVRTPRQPRIPPTTFHPSPPLHLRGLPGLVPLPGPRPRPAPPPKGTISIARYQQLAPFQRMRTVGFAQASYIDSQLAQRQRLMGQVHYQQRLQNYAARIGLHGEQSPRLAAQLKAEQARNPHFQNDLNQALRRYDPSNFDPISVAGHALGHFGYGVFVRPAQIAAADIRGQHARAEMLRRQQERFSMNVAKGVGTVALPAVVKLAEGKTPSWQDWVWSGLTLGAGPLRVAGALTEGGVETARVIAAARAAAAAGDERRAQLLFQTADAMSKGAGRTVEAYRGNEGLIRPAIQRFPVLTRQGRAFAASAARAQRFAHIDSQALTGDITRLEATNRKRAFDQVMINAAKQAGVRPRDFIDTLHATSPHMLDQLAAGHELTQLHQGGVDLPWELHPQQLYQKAPPLDPAAGMPSRLRLKGLTPQVYNLIKRGAEYRDWYDRGAAVIKDFAARTGISDKQAAGIVAVTSQSANPTFNLKRAAEAVKAIQRGEDISHTMMGGQFTKVKHIIENPETFDWSGVKTNNYFANFLKRLDPAEYARMYGADAQHATIDRHMANMFLGKQAVTEAQYEKLKSVMIRTAEKLGWSPEEVQAAAWVPWKADQMGLTQEYKAVLRHAEKTGLLPKHLELPPGFSSQKLTGANKKLLQARSAWAREHYAAGLRNPDFTPKGGAGYLSTANDAYARGQELYRAPTPEQVGEINPATGDPYLYQRGTLPGDEAAAAQARAEAAAAQLEAAGRGRPDVRFTESSEPAHVSAFVEAAARNPRKEFLTPYTPEELTSSGARVFLSHDGHAGYAITRGGDLINVFRNPEGVKGAGAVAVEQAIANGARTLDNFDGALSGIYHNAGFREVARMRFNPEFAPEGWDYAAHDNPDIVFMAHGAQEVPGRYLTDWEQAKQLSSDAVPLRQEFKEPPRTAGEAVMGAGQKRGVEYKGLYERIPSMPGHGIIHETNLADVSTLQHELMHHVRGHLSPELEAVFREGAGLKPGQAWDTAAEEHFANGWLTFLHEGRDVPRNWVDILDTLRPELQRVIDQKDLVPITDAERAAYRTLAGHENSSEIGQALLRYLRVSGRFIGTQAGMMPTYFPRDPEAADAYLNHLNEIAQAEGHDIKHAKIPRMEPGEESAATGGPGGAEIRRVMAGRLSEADLQSLGEYGKVGAKADVRSARQAQAETRALRSPELKARSAASMDAFESGGGGLEGHYASMAPLKGVYSGVDLGQKPEVDQKGIDFLLNFVTHHPTLEGQGFTQRNAREALLKVVNGERPQPAEAKLLHRLFGKEVNAETIRSWAKTAKPQDWLREIVNLPRSMEATMDQSAMFRHMMMVLMHSPEIWAKQPVKMYRALFSASFHEDWMKAIEDHPLYALAVKAGVPFTDLGVDPLTREEQYMSILAERIPGFGRMVKASDRSYSGALNGARMALFEKLVRKAAGQGHDLADPHALESIGKFVGSATGRGDLGVLKRYTEALQSTFFSPRLLASRVNFMSPVYYYSLHPFARREAAKGMVRLLGTAYAVMNSLKLAGANVGMDPTSANFGRVMIGNSRIDLFGGFQDPIRIAAQLYERKITSSVTGRAEKLTGGPGASSMADILWRFFQNKLAPVPGGAVEALQQKDPATGEPLGWAQLGWPKGLLPPVNPSEWFGPGHAWHPGRAVTSNIWLNHMLPLVSQDMAALPTDKEYLAPGPWLGIGVHTYGLPPAGQKQMDKLTKDMQIAGLGKPPAAVIRDSHWKGVLDQAIYAGQSSYDKAAAARKVFNERYPTQPLPPMPPKMTAAEAETYYLDVRKLIAPYYDKYLGAVDKVVRAKQGLQQEGPGTQPVHHGGGVVHSIEHGFGDVIHGIGGVLGSAVATPTAGAAVNPPARQLAAVHTGGLPHELAGAISSAAARYNVPAQTLAGIWAIESGRTFPNPAVNHLGYGGLFGTTKWNASTQEQADYAAQTLHHLLVTHGGNMAAALHAYSGGGYTSVPGVGGGWHAGGGAGGHQFAPAAMGGFEAPAGSPSGGGHVEALMNAMEASLASGHYNPAQVLEQTLHTLSSRPLSGNVAGINFELPKGGPAAPQARGAIALAEHYLGTPYVWGGESPGGFDCSGLLQYVWAKMGIRIPRTSQQQFEAGRRVGRGQLRPGDAVFFVGSDGTRAAPGHVGMYIGGGKFIEAPHTGATVRISNLNGYPGYVGARRYR